MAQPPMPPPAVAVAVEPRGKPRWFTAITVIAIVLAALSLFGSLGGLLSATISEQMAMVPGLPPDMAPLMKEMTEKMREASMPLVTAALAAVQLPVGVWVLVTAIRLHQRKPGSARGFARAMVAFALIEAVMLAFTIVVQVRSNALVLEMVERMRIGRGPGMPPEAERMMQTFMQASIVMGIVFAVAWAALKIGFALYARHYVGKPEVRAFTAG